MSDIYMPAKREFAFGRKTWNVRVGDTVTRLHFKGIGFGGLLFGFVEIEYKTPTTDGSN